MAANDTGDFDYIGTSRLLWQTVGTFVCILGCGGHAMTIIVVMKSRMMRSQCYGVLIVGLSIAGVQTLTSGMLRRILLAFSDSDVDVRKSSDVGCRTHVLWTYVAISLNAWLQAIVAVDRTAAVYLAERYRKHCTWQLGIQIVTALHVIGIGINVPIYFMVELTDTQGCFYIGKHSSEWQYIHFFVYPLLPTIVIVVSNAFIIAKAYKTKLSCMTAAIRSLTVMLLTVNITFTITSLPIAVILIIDLTNPVRENRDNTLSFLQSMFNLLMYSGTASTFFIYCATGTKFRSKIRSIFSRTGMRRQSILPRISSVAPFDPNERCDNQNYMFNHQ